MTTSDDADSSIRNIISEEEIAWNTGDADAYASRFHVEGSDIECQLRSYRALPPGVVEPADGILRTRLLQVFVKEQEEWWTVAYHNVDVKPLPNRGPA